MRKSLLTLVIVLLGCASQARAGVSIHIGVGGYHCGYQGFCGGHGYSYCYPYHYYGPVYYGGYSSYPSVGYYDSSYVAYSPEPANAPPTVPPPAPAPSTTPQTTQKLASNQIPYGFDIGTKLIKSPWSGFVISGAAKAPGAGRLRRQHRAGVSHSPSLSWRCRFWGVSPKRNLPP